jgi:hypothetical protein
MANRQHLEILAKGVEAWNAWRRDHYCIGPELHGPNLSGEDLSGKELTSADLSDANLMGANLSDAELTGANLTDANLTDADLSRASIGYTTFANTDLGKARGLDSVIHWSPSTIGIDTIYRSGGNIPEVFLRGAGVPENFITFMKSLTGSALEFYSCFISYSTKDQEFADRLHADLQAKGVRCWFAPHDVQAGRKLHEQIDEAIRLYDKLLLILSDHSMNSEWVKTEISKARKRERKEQRRMLFPISLVPFSAIQAWECFDADAGKDSAQEVREYLIPDFSNWKDHDSYQRAFNRLVNDLKARPLPPPLQLRPRGDSGLTIAFQAMIAFSTSIDRTGDRFRHIGQTTPSSSTSG